MAMHESTEPTIRVTEADTKTDTLVCVDVDSNIWINRGFPRNTDTGIVDKEVMRNLSGPPYVFVANELTLIDDKHTQGMVFHNVRVIFMHAGRRSDQPWVFSSLDDGYPVVETVEKTNAYLQEQGEGPIQVVLGCNNYPEQPLGIKIGDFPPNSGIVYAVGETVQLMSACMSDSAQIKFTAYAHDFWGIDELSVAQQIRVVATH